MGIVYVVDDGKNFFAGVTMNQNKVSSVRKHYDAHVKNWKPSYHKMSTFYEYLKTVPNINSISWTVYSTSSNKAYLMERKREAIAKAMAEGRTILNRKKVPSFGSFISWREGKAYSPQYNRVLVYS